MHSVHCREDRCPTFAESESVRLITRRPQYSVSNSTKSTGHRGGVGGGSSSRSGCRIIGCDAPRQCIAALPRGPHQNCVQCARWVDRATRAACFCRLLTQSTLLLFFQPSLHCARGPSRSNCSGHPLSTLVSRSASGEERVGWSRCS